MKITTAFIFVFFFSLSYSQVTFDGGVTFYTDSSETTLCSGKFRKFYPGYKLRSTATYEKGQLNGESIEYDKEGNITAKIYYLNGKLEGESVEYYPATTILKSRFNYSKGEKHGECFTYNETGEVIDKRVFENGVLK
jgi:antitoxin component YwqK of YwqJK toxin-antitoxin module